MFLNGEQSYGSQPSTGLLDCFSFCGAPKRDNEHPLRKIFGFLAFDAKAQNEAHYFVEVCLVQSAKCAVSGRLRRSQVLLLAQGFRSRL